MGDKVLSRIHSTTKEAREATKKRTKEKYGSRVMSRRPSSGPVVLEVTDPIHGPQKPGSAAASFSMVELTGSTGKKYKVVIPTTYMKHVPKVWSWDNDRYRVAEMIADGVPIRHIADDPSVHITSRAVIYAWLQHPEFSEHVDGLIMETGFAARRERIAGVSKISGIVFEKLLNELRHVDITDKNTAAFLQGLPTLMKYIAQEKGEFVEESRVTQNTTINGAVAVGHMDLDKMLDSTTSEERKALEAEFDVIGDDIIKSITGE